MTALGEARLFEEGGTLNTEERSACYDERESFRCLTKKKRQRKRVKMSSFCKEGAKVLWMPGEPSERGDRGNPQKKGHTPNPKGKTAYKALRVRKGGHGNLTFSEREPSFGGGISSRGGRI